MQQPSIASMGPFGPSQLHPIMQSVAADIYSRHSIPLTPSPTSPYRAHRQQHHVVSPTKFRPKPYHRPASENHHHLTLPGTGAPSPFSPFTPTSLSSSSSSSQSSGLLHDRHLLSRSLSCTSDTTFSTPAESLDSHQLLDSFNGITQFQHHHQQRSLQRADSAPAILPFPPNSSSQSSEQSSSTLQIPIFASNEHQQTTASPLVFTAEYIDAELAKHGGGQVFTGIPSSTSAPHHQAACSNSALEYQGAGACSDIFTNMLNDLDASQIFGQAASESLLSTFPYASAYVSTRPTTVQPVEQPSGTAAAAKPDVKKAEAERIAEEVKKQKYAVDLIETAIKTLHKIWPETTEPDAVVPPNPVTSDGRLRATAIAAVASASSEQQQRAKTLLHSKHHLKANQQQHTPDSSPDGGQLGGKERKRSGSNQEAEAEVAQTPLKKRTVCDGSPDERYSIMTLPLPKPDQRPTPSTTTTTTSVQSSQQISLRLFVRELLRRSKTSCNTLEVALCYLDGIEETVKKLRDCLKLGIAFGTVAMSERGPYDEGMKDEGRIIKLDELRRMQELEDDAMDVQGEWSDSVEEWAPLSPESDGGPENKPSKAVKPTAPPQPSSSVLATHPLLDARRTFLAALVLATKFIQDKAYSNKAWAKLSGLAGKEVGRCERALGGALQWRLWVGKEVGAGSSIRGRSPAMDETDSLCSGESESVVHGENDPVAKALIAQAIEQEQLRSSSSAIGESAKDLLEAAAAFAAAAASATTAGPAPLPAPAQVAADMQMATRAGCGRARTWPSLQIETNPTTTLEPPVPPLSASSTSFSLSDRLAAVHIQQTPAIGLLQTASLVPPAASILNCTLPAINWLSSSDVDCTSGLPSCSSPLNLAEDNDFLEGILRGSECPTVRMGDDTMDEKTPMGSPFLRMNGSFSTTDESPPPGILEAWLSTPSFPFTFSVTSSSDLLRQVQQSQQQPIRSRSVGSLPSSQQPLLHPQTAALRASGSSGSSLSPHSSSTFSSPEVLTPVHSRSSTLVDATEYEYQKLAAANSEKSFQQSFEKLYGCYSLQQLQNFPTAA